MPQSAPATPARAFIWNEREGMRDLLPDIPGPTEARAINDGGAIAGNLSVGLGPHSRGFYWTARDNSYTA
ncbi:MAG TPA: hypothetical protein VMN60_10755 [Longimicrobiales bacterium]|nr:hypothetical protein [Longimicrobiales bacterium]